MPEIKYVGPFAAVEVSDVGTVERGETVEVSASVAKSLLDQPGNWQPGQETALSSMTVDQLRKLADDRQVDLGDASRKADIIALIEKEAD